MGPTHSESIAQWFITVIMVRHSQSMCTMRQSTCIDRVCKETIEHKLDRHTGYTSCTSDELVRTIYSCLSEEMLKRLILFMIKVCLNPVTPDSHVSHSTKNIRGLR